MAEQDLGPTASRPADVVTRAVLVARTPQITVSTTAPASPAVGDVWIDAS